MKNNTFKAATTKQYQFAISIKKRIVYDIENMDNINEFNKLVNANFNKEELLYFFKEKDDYKYFIEQNNINTNSVVLSAMLKLSK
ncbi:hypothetical protein [Staphylococcus equorum]|uniref:hypothetical protein n=1 Tax=Staphylococcus equorum TaxID=246432 RepID=UPI00255638F4|nr:hypothetical protein [Staphylococcus equorum]MDK9850180.1 hypothetical protein [Staphylococcus equorum]